MALDKWLLPDTGKGDKAGRQLRDRKMREFEREREREYRKREKELDKLKELEFYEKENMLTKSQLKKLLYLRQKYIEIINENKK